MHSRGWLQNMTSLGAPSYIRSARTFVSRPRGSLAESVGERRGHVFCTENCSSQSQNLALPGLSVPRWLDSGTLIVLLGCRQWLLSVFTWGNIHLRPSPLRPTQNTGGALREARHTLVYPIATPCIIEKKRLECFGAKRLECFVFADGPGQTPHCYPGHRPYRGTSLKRNSPPP